MPLRKASEIKLTDEEKAVLERYLRRRKTGRSMAQRAEIILRAASGENNCEIARAVQATRQTVRVWRERFVKRRLDGLDDEPRPGAPRKIGDECIEAIIVKTLEEKPANATHWSTRDMARAAGISASSVHRVWRAFSLQPHHVETFKLSKDAPFIEKVQVIVGFIMTRPIRR